MMAVESAQKSKMEGKSLTYINALCAFVVLVLAGIVVSGDILVRWMKEQHRLEILTSLGTTCIILGTLGVGIIGAVLAGLEFPGIGYRGTTFGLSALSCLFSHMSVLQVEHGFQQGGLLALGLIYKSLALVFGWGKLDSCFWASLTVIGSTSMRLIVFPLSDLSTSAGYIAVDITVAVVILSFSILQKRAFMAMNVFWKTVKAERDVFEKVMKLSCDGVAWVSVDAEQGLVLTGMSEQLLCLLGSDSENEHVRAHRLSSYFPDEQSYTDFVDAISRIHTTPLMYPTQLRNELDDTLKVELIVAPHQKIDQNGVQTAAYMIAVRMCAQTISRAPSHSSCHVSPQFCYQSESPSQHVLVNASNGGTPASVTSGVASVAAQGSTPQASPMATHQQERSTGVPRADIIGRRLVRAETSPLASAPSAQVTSPEVQNHDISRQTCNVFSSESILDLTRLIELGKKEHWLISCSEVELQPQMLLGKGGFGVVVEAKFYGATLAAKFSKEVKHVDLNDRNRSSSMLHELRMLRHARHPNIVPFYGACIEPTSREIVLLFEVVQAPTLVIFGRVEYEKRKKVHGNSSMLEASDRRLVKVLIGICNALLYLHARSPPLVHADLKPPNVFVAQEEGNEPHAMLADFGLATQLPVTRAPGFTTRWAPPEVILNAEHTSTAADVFSFGRVVTFIMTGKAPLPSMSETEIISHLRSGTTNPMPVQPEGVLQESCITIQDMCLEPSPADRPSTESLHGMIERLPSVIADAYEEAKSQSSQAGSSGSRFSNMLGIVPLLPGSMDEEVADIALATQPLARPDTQRWVQLLQLAREAAAADELI
eukprot:TRINITY_DN33160_c0_g1_i2.p1 TRINITY_DN33160_c0_g1~~TRINITY_DN33160_c0_g1_i2.p1  ORF type:complete len:826 (-),score=90.56 TRINITY_DN33160_c0_g1_i2:43-2520(-)